MPYELLALPTSSQVLYELLALVFEEQSLLPNLVAARIYIPRPVVPSRDLSTSFAVVDVLLKIKGFSIKFVELGILISLAV